MTSPGIVTPDVVDLIRAKRDGSALAAPEIRSLIDAYTRGDVAEEQMSSLLMAIYFRGLNGEELQAWTGAMIESGRRLDLGGVGRPTVDKHSTGGVGDKISLVLVPLVAHCGAAVPQLSGRGLGHTGGTLDKLEAVRGVRTDLAPDEMLAVLERVGCVICGAGPDLAPADRKLYALRDVTATVESIPLIASSIMSKKIAEGTSALVLDVKVGRGAFMRDVGAARLLAETMVGLGPAYGVRTTAVLTRMDEPIGRMIGNALEVAESVETLRGGGPSDVVELTVALAEEMLVLAGIPAGPARVLGSGAAFATYEAMVRAQGGDPEAPLPEASHRQVVRAPASGYLRHLDALDIGTAAWRLGAGRARKEDPVSAGAGVVVLARPGERVEAGQPLLELRTDDRPRLDRAEQTLEAAIEIGPEPVNLPPRVIEVIRE
jgi:thymidine phosphorylase